MTPYGGRENPYQFLTKSGLEAAGCSVLEFPKRHFFPLKHVEGSDVDVIHMDWPHSFFSSNQKVLDFWKKRQFLWELNAVRSPIVWTAHNLATHNTSSQKPCQYMQALVDRADGIMSLSEAGCDMVREYYNLPDSKYVFHVPHGHYVDYYENKVSEEDARDILQIPQSVPVGVFLGRVQPYKGLEKVIELYVSDLRLREHHLVIAGNPISSEYAAQLLDLCQGCERIHLHFGFIEDTSIQNFYNAASYAVFPFKKVFNSGSLMLALSYGVPVVIPNHPVLLEMVAGCSYGVFEDVADIPSVILEVVSSTHDRVQIINHVQNQYSWQRVGEELKMNYIEVLGG